MEDNETIWSSLATRAIRVLLARKEVSYARLAAELSRLGELESTRSVEGKVQRGAFRFSFFLQSLSVTGADFPPHWGHALSAKGDWSQRASRLFLSEIKARPWLTWPEVARRLELIGEKISPEHLAAQAQGGEFPATLFLQCSVICDFHGLELFLDHSDLLDAAKRGMKSTGKTSKPAT